MPGALQKPNAEHALLLLQNVSCDKQCRQLLLKAEGMTLMLELLKQYAGGLVPSQTYRTPHANYVPLIQGH